VSLTPEVTSRGVRRAVLRELVIQHQDTELGRKLPVYDGNKVRFSRSQVHMRREFGEKTGPQFVERNATHAARLLHVKDTKPKQSGIRKVSQYCGFRQTCGRFLSGLRRHYRTLDETKQNEMVGGFCRSGLSRKLSLYMSR
jgi:hypothetical protein